MRKTMIAAAFAAITAMAWAQSAPPVPAPQVPGAGQQQGQQKGKRLGKKDGSGPQHAPGTGGGSGGGQRRGRK